MKKSLARKITLSILAGAVLMSSNVVWATPVTQVPDVGVPGWTEDTTSNIWHTSGVEIQFDTSISTDKDFASAFNSNGDATGGKVTINGGLFTGLIRGGYAASGNANENTVIINAGQFQKNIYGGNTNKGNADGNTVEIKGGSFTGSSVDVYGGLTYYGNASNNTVSISNVVANSTFGQVYGGLASGTIGGESSNNTVTIDAEGVEFGNWIHGGNTYKGNANQNTVNIHAGIFKGTTNDPQSGLRIDGMVGGFSEEGSADGNTVNIKGGKFTDSLVFGGKAKNGSASNNTVSISGVEDHSTFGNVYGGQAVAWPATGDASKNTVIINAEKGEFKSVFGGSAYVGNANENTVIISNGTFKDSIYGGSTHEGSADGNTVEIKGGKFNHTVNEDVVYGGYTTNGSASNNTVSISGVNGDFDIVKGGYAGNTSTAGDASNNTVIINAEDGIFKGSIWGGDTRNGSANKNTVIISNGTFEDPIYGGYANDGNASNNTVTINGGTFNGVNIYGGYVSGTGKEAVNNTVNIGGNATLKNGVNIRGGIVNGANPYYGGSASPNTLNLNGWKNNDKSVGLIAGFDVINFNDCKWENGKTVVQIVDFSFDSDLKINVNGMTTDKVPDVDDEMTLLQGVNVMSTEYKSSRATFMASGYERVIGEVYQTEDNKNINLKVNKVSANEAILAFGESRAAASALTNQGSELIETGLDALARDNDKDTKVFAALYGNASEYETGSHVKVNGWNGIVGVGKTNANGVTMGAFFENGEGNYRTFNEYEGEFMRGDGEATYNGGGFLYRKDTASGVYTEASLRAGNLQNELRNAVIANDALAGYDIDTFYYGAHVGIGKVIPRGNEGDSIDVYGKFIYTHYDDEDFTIDGGKFHLDSIESERLRLGFRINEVQNNKLNMYYGAAWEYEFGGDSNNSVVGYDIDVNAPSLEGSTVIGEIGMHYKASEKWSLDLNGRAYVGQREGFSGSVQANYSF